MEIQPAEPDGDEQCSNEQRGQDQSNDEERRSNEEEAKRLRRLQIMMNMVMSVISQDPGLTLEEASELAAGARRAALNMFPDKELAYDLIYRPRVQRVMNERFRLH
ncbi:MAG: hypothetical protein WBQ72_07960 [Terriglobales bacterium]|jgi:hypothetical protein